MKKQLTLEATGRKTVLQYEGQTDIVILKDYLNGELDGVIVMTRHEIELMAETVKGWTSNNK